MKKNNYSLSVLSTFAYFSQFRYPLTFEELHRFLHHAKISKKNLKKVLSHLTQVKKSGDYYFLENDKDIVDIRIKRKMTSLKLLKNSERFCEILALIPTIRLIGVSGSLSMNNCKKGDDVDVFIITRKNSLWISRFLVTLLLLIFGKKRKKNAKDFDGKICTNMWISEDDLTLKKQNIYIAHEIAQLKVIKDKGLLYNAFLSNNSWIYSFLPNTQKIKMVKNQNLAWDTVSRLILPLEILAYKFQLFYMRKSKKTETVKRSLAMFHPKDCNNKVLSIYEKRTLELVKDYQFNQKLSKNKGNKSHFSFSLITPGS